MLVLQTPPFSKPAIWAVRIDCGTRRADAQHIRGGIGRSMLVALNLVLSVDDLIFDSVPAVLANAGHYHSLHHIASPEIFCLYYIVFGVKYQRNEETKKCARVFGRLLMAQYINSHGSFRPEHKFAFLF